MSFIINSSTKICILEQEVKQIQRATIALKEDILKVSDKIIEVVNNIELKENNIIIATIDSYEKIFSSETKEKLDLEFLKSESESFIIDVVDTDLIIVGSDMRGAIFGIYELSKMIGVSPFHYWADVPVLHKDVISIEDKRIVSLTPSIKYRGLFINDERNLQLWSRQFEDANKEIIGSPNKYIYERVFDLLLRLKANTLWPAMHRYSTPFYKVKDKNGISINAKTADDYGIIIGTSHCEPMLRNNEGEWLDFEKEYMKKKKRKERVSYDFTVNKDIIKDYWAERVQDSKGFESMYTIGMRGVHDEGFTTSKLEDDSLKGKIELMGEIIEEQNDILKNNLDDSVDPIKVFIPYKEVSQFYNGDKETKGLHIDDDVIIMYANDNFGYIRQVPSKSETQSHSAFGLYYHISYWGAPLSYLWLNSTPLTLMYNQLKKAYDNQMRDLWVLNVGDIKLSEIGMDFFLEIAHDINKYSLNNINEYLEKFSKQNFACDDDTSAQVSKVISDYFKLAFAKKPEFYGLENQKLEKYTLENENYFSVLHFDEADNMLSDILELEKEAKSIFDKIRKEYQDSFYEMVLYSIISLKNVIRKQIYFQKSVLAKQRYDHKSYYKYTIGSMQSQVQILKETKHFNKDMANGKWKKIVAPYPRPHFSSRHPWSKKLKIVPLINPALPYKLPPMKIKKAKIQTYIPLPMKFNSLSNASRFIHLYSTSFKKLDFEVVEKSEFINLQVIEDDINIYPKIKVDINWNSLNVGENKGTIKIVDSNRNINEIEVLATNQDLNLNKKTHAQNGDYFSINAVDYLYLKESIDNKSKWVILDNLGRKSSMMSFIGEKQEDINSTAKIVYEIYAAETGTYKGEIFRLPTLNEASTDFKENTCDLAIGIGNEVSIAHGQTKSNSVLEKGTKEMRKWYQNVLENCDRVEFEIEIKQVGNQELVVYGLDNDISFEKIVLYKGEKISSYFGMM